MLQFATVAVLSSLAFFNLSGCRADNGEDQCERDADCLGWWVCEENRCVILECRTSGDCDRGDNLGDDSKASLICHASGYCAQPCETANDDCDRDGSYEGWICRDQVCTKQCEGTGANACGEVPNIFSCDDSDMPAFCVPGNVKGTCDGIGDNCRACSFEDDDKCLWCSDPKNIPDYNGSCAPLCVSSASAAINTRYMSMAGAG